MRRRISLAVLLVVVIATGAQGCKRNPKASADNEAGTHPVGGIAKTAAGPSSSADDRCTPNCELRAKELGCRQPEGCQHACTLLHEAKHCSTQLQAFMRCFLKEPKDHWQCDPEGIPEVKEDFCEGERGNVMDCLHASNGQL
jgi:hypothetical protein